MVKPIRAGYRPTPPQIIQIDDGVADPVAREQSMQGLAHRGPPGINRPIQEDAFKVNGHPRSLGGRSVVVLSTGRGDVSRTGESGSEGLSDQFRRLNVT